MSFLKTEMVALVVMVLGALVVVGAFGAGADGAALASGSASPRCTPGVLVPGSPIAPRCVTPADGGTGNG